MKGTNTFHFHEFRACNLFDQQHLNEGKVKYKKNLKKKERKIWSHDPIF